MTDDPYDAELLADIPPEVRAWVDERIPLHLKKSKHGTARWFTGLLHLRIAASHIEAASAYLDGGMPGEILENTGHEDADEMLEVFARGVEEMMKWELEVLAVSGTPGKPRTVKDR